MDLRDANILVTGGASFIGSHLVDKLVKISNNVSIIDNFSTGKEEWVNKKARIYYGNLLDIHEATRAMEGKDVVFHLAAVHGGREFIEKYPSEVAQSFAINSNVIRIANQMRVKKLVFSSSVCIYPLKLQEFKHGGTTELDDGFLEGVFRPDGIYGLTKLTAEQEIKTYRLQHGLPAGIARFSTVYGPRMNNTHALMALIERALKHQDPYLVWGDGNQGRDWLYVKDAVNALIKIAEEEEDATSYNVVSSGTLTMKEIINEIFTIIDWRPKEIFFDKTKPVGPRWRSISSRRISNNLDFISRIAFEDGLKETINYVKSNV